MNPNDTRRSPSSRAGRASYAERAAADRLPRRPIGWVGLLLALVTFGLVVACLWPALSDSYSLFFLLYGAGHVTGWWIARPRREAALAYDLVASLLLIQLGIYLVFWLTLLMRWGGTSSGGLEWLIPSVFAAFFLLGPVSGLAALAAVRCGWVTCLVQWLGPLVFVLLS